MRKISIIGLGWLGMSLAQALQSSGMQVVGSKTTTDGVEAACKCGIDCYLLNLNPQIICEADDIDQLMSVDVLVVMLPVSGIDGSEGGYIKAVQLIVDTALSYSVPRIIFTSSTSVYGSSSGHLNEDNPLYPETLSARALVELENWLHQLPNTSVDVLRLAGLVGNGRHAGRFLSGRKAVQGGDKVVNLVHQDDVISAIKLLIQQPEGGHIYNLCAPIHPKRSEFYPLASRQLDLAPPEFLQSENKDVESKIIDGSRICRELGFEYQFPDPGRMPMS
ncbi:NAD-dependent epimerase/dehydratase family protein [Xenorhabdus nematophila]|uniref:NAD-dependent epimerase/dehydratase family protein n=1 Tax=Xenorhabdus nematophila TaxID=628 RepID=UPI0003275D75|nr:NAD-dependent epimerase/dehydratase family protein [Xenorhabdus nematophila]CCW29498.1 Protein yeeZ [Xenorhabdus nematophila F1]CEE94746.1 putative enzyme with NAD(P)-binding domain [Xenorhabdus nematophila str. Anatoliense]CEE95673.1 putative enzyme with NAD(P)-binding domain [Xenorhabdus nematophila str. Anatoliense]